MSLPAFGLNRFDFASPAAFAADVQRAETLGWDWAFLPSSPLLVRDPYVMLAAAALATERIGLGPLIENPVMRHPAVIASSIATLEGLAEGRVMLGCGVGDTAVRLSGQRPARVAELEAATRLMRRLLAGEPVEVGSRRTARLAHARPVPVWIAAGGPRTLRMAGGVADGVFIRVGRHPDNLQAAVDAVREGARAAGRDPDEVKLGLVLHTILGNDAQRVAAIGRSIAAGYYEYTPALFERARLDWSGPPIEHLSRQVWPDFHHTRYLAEAGKLVDFLPDEAVDAFALRGTAVEVARQLAEVLELELPIEILVPHPVPVGDRGTSGYAERFPREVRARLER